MTKTVRVFETGSVFEDILLENTPQNVVCGGEYADLGVIMPGYDKPCTGRFGILLKPEYAEYTCFAGNVVTYGMAPHNTVTLSSVGDEKCIMSIQREIVTIYGDVLEPQEIIIPRRHLSPYDAMAAAAALVIAGAEMKPES